MVKKLSVSFFRNYRDDYLLHEKFPYIHPIDLGKLNLGRLGYAISHLLPDPRLLLEEVGDLIS
jgi:hypothetical protein